MSSAKAPELTLYGTGLGDVPRVLLRRKRLRRLNVKIMNASIFALVLHLTEQLDWLSDPRVNLLLAQENELVMVPFLFLSAELELADERSAKLRDRVLIQSRREVLNGEFADEWVFKRLDENLALLRQDQDVAALFGTMKGREAYVLATGPTLAGHFARLKQVRERAERPSISVSIRPCGHCWSMGSGLISLSPWIAISTVVSSIPTGLMISSWSTYPWLTMGSWPAGRDHVMVPMRRSIPMPD